jgi:hypothetical protein
MEIPDKCSASDLAPQPTPAPSRLRLYVSSSAAELYTRDLAVEDSPAVRLALNRVPR